jgi:hypothetical protein
MPVLARPPAYSYTSCSYKKDSSCPVSHTEIALRHSCVSDCAQQQAVYLRVIDEMKTLRSITVLVYTEVYVCTIHRTRLLNGEIIAQVQSCNTIKL